MREITSHKVNGANETIRIEVVDEPGSGGANHNRLTGFAVYEDALDAEQDDSVIIAFQRGPIKEAGVNGVTQEALLAIVADTLKAFQAGPYACEDNAVALENVEAAIERLQRRTKARIELTRNKTMKPLLAFAMLSVIACLCATLITVTGCAVVQKAEADLSTASMLVGNADAYAQTVAVQLQTFNTKAVADVGAVKAQLAAAGLDPANSEQSKILDAILAGFQDFQGDVAAVNGFLTPATLSTLTHPGSALELLPSPGEMGPIPLHAVDREMICVR